MNEHDVFAAAACPAFVARATIEAALGATFTLEHDPEPPALVTGATMVFFHGSHPFEDDADFPISRFACWVNILDTAGDTERQLAVAWRVFRAVKGEGWSAMLSYGTQGHLALYLMRQLQANAALMRGTAAGPTAYRTNRPILIEGEPLPVGLRRSRTPKAPK